MFCSFIRKRDIAVEVLLNRKRKEMKRVTKFFAQPLEFHDFTELGYKVGLKLRELTIHSQREPKRDSHNLTRHIDFMAHLSRFLNSLSKAVKRSAR